MAATVFARGKGRGNRFSTRIGAQHMAKRVYICQRCDARYPSKPKASKPVCDAAHGCGHTEFYYFPSEGEANRYAALRFHEEQGLIQNLKLQTKEIYYPIRMPDQRGELVVLFEYRPDFVYWKLGKLIVEDYKARADQAAMTPEFKLKKKAMRIQYGIDIMISTGG